MQKEKTFKKLVLENAFWRLECLPAFGCHWIGLQVPSEGRWVELLRRPREIQTLFAQPLFYGSFLMAPWSNRVQEGTFAWERKIYRLCINFPDRTAIHGEVIGKPFEVRHFTPESFEAAFTWHPPSAGEGFPFPFEVHHAVHLKGRLLEAGLSLKNIAEKPFPVGMGFHPYFLKKPVSRVGKVLLQVPARKAYPLQNGLAVGDPVEVSSRLDFRTPRPVDEAPVDDCLTDLERQEARIFWENFGELEMAWDSVFSHVVVCLPWEADGRPKDHFALEPVTHENNGFVRLAKAEPTAVRVLKPGELFSGRVCFSWCSVKL